MSLNDLPNAELGAIVRASPLWPILIEMEKAKAADTKEKGSEIR